MAEQDMKGIHREMFNTVSAGYDGEALRFFRLSAKHLPDLLGLRGDEQVLDVACGTGHAAIAVAPKLPKGRVTAVDLSPGMLDQARRKAGQLGIGNAEFLERDMQVLGFESRFDIALCAFGIFFVEDMDAQLAHIAATVKAGGTVLVTSFRENYFQPLRDMFFRRMEAFGAPRPPEAWQRVATEAGCRQLFEKAGLTNVRVETRNVGYYLSDEREWWEIVWNAGLRRFVAALSPEEQERFRREHEEEIGALRTSEGIRLDVDVLYTVGTKG